MGQVHVTPQPTRTSEAAVLQSNRDLATDTVVIPAKLCNLPPMNEIASQVLMLSSDPEIDLVHLASVMRRDTAFAADVLLLANSSLFGFPQRMQSLRHAVAILGLDRIRALAVTVAMRGFVAGGNALVDRCWQHSAACAIIAEEIARVFGVASEVAYTVGLMQDVGLLGFIKCYAKEAEALMSGDFVDIEQALAAERALLQVEHGRAGAWLVRNWCYPPMFEICCDRHHEPLDSGDPELVKLVKMSCRLADAIEFPVYRYSNAPGYDDVIGSLPPEFSPKMFPPRGELKASVEAKLSLFE